MTKLRNFSQQYTILFVIIITVLMRGLLSLSGALSNLFPETLVWNYIFEILDILWPAGIALLFGYAFVFREKGFGSTLTAGIAYFLIQSVTLMVVVFDTTKNAPVQWVSMPAVILGIISLFGIGFREEILFRGVIQNALALKYAKNTKGIWLTVILSGFLFGLIHMFNIVFGVDFASAFRQSISAMGIGILFAAIYLRGGSIWCLILMHMITDTAGLFESTFIVSNVTNIDQMNSLSSIGPYITIPIDIIISVFLLRKSKRPAIYERLEALRSKLSLQQRIITSDQPSK